MAMVVAASMCLYKNDFVQGNQRLSYEIGLNNVSQKSDLSFKA